jgi:hypothetical protein
LQLVCLRQQRSFSAPKGKINQNEQKICKTNPILEMPKMNVSPYPIITMNKKLRTMNSLKRTQTNPILSALVADKIAPLFRMSFILRGLVPPVSAKRSEDGSQRKRFMLTSPGKFSKKYRIYGSVAQ